MGKAYERHKPLTGYPVEDEMRDIIESELKEIEEKEGVKILFAVESGSRAWGFASPDSDYDVRFIYVRPAAYYLRLDNTRDVIEWKLNDTFDINGWDLQKALRLLHASNPTVFEWALSPIVYRTSREWERFSEVIRDYHLKKKGLYHYLNMSKRKYLEFLTGEEVKLKKYFYVLRPLLACKWILTQGTPPPMPFDDLAAKCLDPEIKPIVQDLIARKRETPEFGTDKRIDRLNDYLLRETERINAIIETLPPDQPSDWDTLNKLFLETIGYLK